MNRKIVFIASYPQSLLSFRLALLKEFLQRDFQVVAIAPPDQIVETVLKNLNIKYIPVALERNGLNPFSDLGLCIKLRNILKKEKPDITFSYTIKPIIYGSVAAKLAKIPKIYSMITGTGYVFLDHNFKSKVVGLIARKLFRVALYFNTLVFFQNKDNPIFFQQKKIISKKKPIAIINGSGVNCQEFLPVDYPSSISFLMIARLLYDKGVREYVAAAKKMKEKYPSITFKLVGWIDSNPNSITQQELNEWTNAGIIEFLGKLSDVRPAIASSSVYVLPSYHEGTPRTVLEAMAMARPIITTNAPGCNETVIDNKTGFMVPIKNVDKLVSAMDYFISNPTKISEMGKASREFAVQKYDVHKVNDSILKNIL